MDGMSVIVLVGATATGKSALAVECAHALKARGVDAEIVNADSMLVYRGMDIGTAKPTEAERGGIVHHLIDTMEISEVASVADFQTRARAAIDGVVGAGGVPIVVGGSSLYVHAIVDQFEFPGQDADIRGRWQAELDRIGPQALHERLRSISPESAARIEPGNGRRIVRALEVAELTGTHRPSLPAWTYALDGVRQFGLELPREQLDSRINARVEAMWAAGLVAEVAGLMEHGLRDSVTASRAIGYRQVIEFLDGNCTEEDAKEAVKRATRRFFRRQLAWYRRDHRITWLPAGDASNVEAILTSVSFS